MTAASPVKIFHITAIENLPSIMAEGLLCAKALLTAQGLRYSNIAYQGAQGARAVKTVTRPPGGKIHDYVPFYFAPRSPMLFTINNGNVDGCPHRQQDIVHLVTTVEKVKLANIPFVFYDHNATLEIAKCYDSTDDFDKINWSIFFESPRIEGYCKYWHSTQDAKYILRMETRQAEFLAYHKVPLSLIDGIGTYNEAKAAEVRLIVNASGLTMPVNAKPGWYY